MQFVKACMVRPKYMKNVRNKINKKLLSIEKDGDIKTTLYVPNVFNNDLVAIGKSKITSTFNKPAYICMCILNLSKVLMYLCIKCI